MLHSSQLQKPAPLSQLSVLHHGILPWLRTCTLV